jgi:hypothetical protein
MNERNVRRPWQRVGTFGLVYFGLGVASAIISNDLESASLQASIRVGILLVAVAFFYWHFRVELARSTGRLRVSALIASGALAFGTLLLALYAVGAAWWNSSHLPASLLSSLVIWPVATGVPAFLAALVLGRVMLRIRSGMS